MLYNLIVLSLFTSEWMVINLYYNVILALLIFRIACKDNLLNVSRCLEIELS